MKIAVVALNRNEETLSRINPLLTAADTMVTSQDEIEVWLLGNGPFANQDDVQQINCDKLVWVRGNSLDPYLPEIFLDVLTKIFSDRFPDMLLFNGDFSGNELAVRMGFRIGGSCVTETRRIDRAEESITVTKRRLRPKS